MFFDFVFGCIKFLFSGCLKHCPVAEILIASVVAPIITHDGFHPLILKIPKLFLSKWHPSQDLNTNPFSKSLLTCIKCVARQKA
ncbi:hypothetical protein RCL_jg6018.t1 [Rhizophagus clarus]|uniref:Uncharacterized protein n=1 Tax=Rhizophagus clarus TaxID=94130 RepID=A0A8H3L4D4_9GLOM|nr:hypothetical protein RCL_jg6018.t1 [Rhizophagus clarus]